MGYTANQAIAGHEFKGLATDDEDFTGEVHTCEYQEHPVKSGHSAADLIHFGSNLSIKGIGIEINANG